MTQLLMTNQAKTKIQELSKSPIFRNSLNKFVKVSDMYLRTKKRIPGGYNPLESQNKYMLQKVHMEDDLFIFRDRSNRFIFTIDKDEKENDVPILIDVITRAEVKSRLKSNNTILKI